VLSGIPNHNGQGTPILGGNTVNISTVVMLGFWLCQFNTGSLACGLCLSSMTGFFVWLLQFNISSLGFGRRSLSLELHCCVPI
jgi:hypothetical protein